MASGGDRTVSNDDAEICEIYNFKEERMRGAVEIVLDDDDDGSVCNQRGSSSTFVRYTANASTSGAGPSSQFIDVTTLEANVFSSQVNASTSDSPFVGGINPTEIETLRGNLERARYWEYSNLGSEMVNSSNGINSQNKTVFSVMSYNVLSQALLEEHSYLYNLHDSRALSWAHRSEILLKEFTLANADILCLQEVQESHIATFYNRLNGLGYKGIFKKRTGSKGDGSAIYFKKSMFTLVAHSSVEYYQPGVQMLNRDNVGLVVKLALNGDALQRQIVVATTHLLFNQKRHDVKLAQMQLLLAEVERFAYIGEHSRSRCPVYCSSIITGDMNFEPFSGVYQLMTGGMLRYQGLTRQLNQFDDGRSDLLNSHLIPRDLEITDTCQHYGLLTRRPNSVSYEEQQKVIKLYHSDHNQYGSYKGYVERMKREGYVNNFTPQPHIPYRARSASPSSLPPEGFGTGQLSHLLNLRSVYHHGNYGHGNGEVTTFQKQWVTVDYIFYSCKFVESLGKMVEGDLKLLCKLRLPKVNEAKRIGSIPNLASPSDHYPLAAVFLLK